MEFQEIGKYLLENAPALGVALWFSWINRSDSNKRSEAHREDRVGERKEYREDINRLMLAFEKGLEQIAAERKEEVYRMQEQSRQYDSHLRLLLEKLAGVKLKEVS